MLSSWPIENIETIHMKFAGKCACSNIEYFSEICQSISIQIILQNFPGENIENILGLRNWPVENVPKIFAEKLASSSPYIYLQLATVCILLQNI